jgi:hypothetical protein
MSEKKLIGPCLVVLHEGNEELISSNLVYRSE